MDISNLEIVAPEGMEYYIENNKVKFRLKQTKKTKLTYNDITKKLFNIDNKIYYINHFGQISTATGKEVNNLDLNNCTSELQAKKLLAINQFMNVAKYLNGDWKPNWNNKKEYKYYIDLEKNRFNILCVIYNNSMNIYFKSYKLAEQAVEILGEETIKLALTTNY